MEFDFLKLILQTPEKQEFVSMFELTFRIGTATVLGFLISGISYLTYNGKSYDRSVLQAQIIVTSVFSIMINVIGQNLAWAIGIFGSLTFVQYRTKLKDARDTSTFLYSVVIGVTCGVGYFKLAGLGFIIMSIVQILLRILPPLEIHHTFIKFSCRHIESKDIIKYFFKSQKVKFELTSISVKSENLVFAVRLSMEDAYELAKKTKAKHPDLIEDFSLNRKL